MAEDGLGFKFFGNANTGIIANDNAVRRTEFALAISRSDPFYEVISELDLSRAKEAVGNAIRMKAERSDPAEDIDTPDIGATGFAEGTEFDFG
jgi:hypothetical protein